MMNYQRLGPWIKMLCTIFPGYIWMYTSVHLVVSLEWGIHDLCILCGSFDLQCKSVTYTYGTDLMQHHEHICVQAEPVTKNLSAWKFCPRIKIFSEIAEIFVLHWKILSGYIASYIYSILNHTVDCKYYGGLFMDDFRILKQLMTYRNWSRNFDPMMHACSSVAIYSYYFSPFVTHRLFIAIILIVSL